PDPLEPLALPQSLPLITLNPTVHVALQQWDSGTAIKVTGYWNAAGPWLRVIDVALILPETR
ncbi:MAG: hypothetical protein VKJ64_03875, partial [Leptolyngbyaceae bacterium]|nr:hypothetical protein [Leptolyngbyaceae bacterium]